MVSIKQIAKKVFPIKFLYFCLDIVTFFVMIYYKLKYRPLEIRKNTSDKSVFASIFVLKELKLPVKINPKLIIDGGAYTGLSTLYYSSKYPKATIIAVEPESTNYDVLVKNTAKRNNVIPIKCGLWSETAKYLKVVDTKTGKWGFQVKEVKEGQKYDARTITITDIMKVSAKTKVDILKLDIEKSEKELFSKNYDSWLNKTNIIVIELHDKKCEKIFYSAINRHEWNEYKDGEKVILVRRRMIE